MSGVQIFTNVGLNQNNITGDAQGETAATGDNDKSLATTEFVQGVGLKFGNSIEANGSATIDATFLGKLIYLTGSSPYTITLPDNSLFLSGTTFSFSSHSTATITISSAQNIITKNGTATSINVTQGDSFSLTKKSTGEWILYGSWGAAYGSFQPLNDNLTGISSLNISGNGIPKKTGAGNWIWDTNDYLLSDQVGVPNGIASLDASGFLLPAQRPIATNTTLGMIKVGPELTIEPDGTLGILEDFTNTFLSGRTTASGKFLFGDSIDHPNVANCWVEGIPTGQTADRVFTMIDTTAVLKVVRRSTTADPAVELQSWDDTLTTLRGYWDLVVINGNLELRDRTSGSSTFLLADRLANTLSTTKTFTAANISGVNTGDQTITLTGAVSGSGTGTFTTTITEPELSALAALPDSAGYIRKTGDASYIIDTTMPVLSTLANGMPSFIETVGGQTVSIETFEFEFGLSSNGTRNAYLQFVDDIVSSATIGRRIPDNMTLVGIYAQCTSVGNNGATAEVRVNGATTIASCPLVAGTMIYNLTSHSINLNAGDRIAVYGSAPTNNWANMIVKLIFRWRD